MEKDTFNKIHKNKGSILEYNKKSFWYIYINDNKFIINWYLLIFY